MKRRTFITGLGGGILAVPVAAGAQQAGKAPRIGVLSSTTATRNPVAEAFEQSLRELGWFRDQNIKIEIRYAAGRHAPLAPLVAELVGLNVDVLVTWSLPAAVAATHATKKIPIVFLSVGDPVKNGLVTNLARPGGNATGVTNVASDEISGKRLQILKEAVPSVTRVAVLISSEQTYTSRGRQLLTRAAKALNVGFHAVKVEAPEELETALRRATEQGAQALYVWPSGFSFSFGKEIADVALTRRLPSIHAGRESVIAGGLLSYGSDLKDIARRGAAYVDKILKGAKPGDLPVELASRFELVINLKTAKALGLTLPQSLLLRADEIIR